MTAFPKSLLRVLPDRWYIDLVYFKHFHTFPNWKEPRTFNEKLQWLKLYDRRPEYPSMVDKVLAKDYASAIIGPEHIIPTLGVWTKAQEIDFDALPERFVLKCNHDSGSVVICKDKETLDRHAAIERLARGIRSNGFWYGREWPYKQVTPKILAEEYISDASGALVDYKVHNFNGVPRFILVCRNRFGKSGLIEDFYDASWNHLEVRRPNLAQGEPIDRPAELDEMLALARALSKGVPFLRTDFYLVNGKILFGELTLFPASGFQPFVPDSYDRMFGDWIELPKE